MTPIVLRPDVKYRRKLFFIAGLSGLLSWAFVAMIAVGIGAQQEGTAGAVLGLLVATGLTLIWLVPTLVLIPAYYRSLQYEIHEDEVIVRAGVVTKSVKHVPFRTVTNLKVTQGPLDRLFRIGALDIQTAGMSGQTGAEESLVGLPNVQEVYERVVEALRRYRGAMAPTQAEEEPVSADGQLLAAILDEVRAIRRALEQS